MNTNITEHEDCTCKTACGQSGSWHNGKRINCVNNLPLMEPKNFNKGGFFDLNIDYLEKCKHPEHEPPTHLYIPEGKGYRHICPSCGKTTDLIRQQISF